MRFGVGAAHAVLRAEPDARVDRLAVRVVLTRVLAESVEALLRCRARTSALRVVGAVRFRPGVDDACALVAEFAAPALRVAATRFDAASARTLRRVAGALRVVGAARARCRFARTLVTNESSGACRAGAAREALAVRANLIDAALAGKGARVRGRSADAAGALLAARAVARCGARTRTIASAA